MSLIGIFVFNYTSPIILAIYVGLVAFFIRDILKEYKFIGMFPIDISPIEMDWGANDSIEEFTVTFAYQWWESAFPVQTTDISGA